MTRREFIALLGMTAASWPLAAHAQQAERSIASDFVGQPGGLPEAMDAFRRELRALGYVDGRTIIIVYRWAEGKPERMRELAMCWSGSRSMSSLHRARSTRRRQTSDATIPFVFFSHADRSAAATLRVLRSPAATSPASP